jgi:predicted lipoprotein with Yx(FWY)xxD motif
MTQESTRSSRIDQSAMRFRAISAALLVAMASVGISFVGVATSGARTRHAGMETKLSAVSVSGVGDVLVTATGRVVYDLSSDHRSRVSCSATCMKYWPQVLADGPVVAGPGVKQSLLGKIKAPNGKEQVTYNKWPLYTYVADTKAKEASGEGVVAFGGTWKAMHPSGSPASKQSSGGGGGGGYGY